jgi:CheY-like chemotaxis protein
MRILIIEDNAFNVFCLSRLLESVITSVLINFVSNSQDALSYIDAYHPNLVIIDGELTIADETGTNGPQLAASILQKYPQLPVIAWSDSELMREAFTQVFRQNNRLVNEYNTWAKNVNSVLIQKTWTYYFGKLSREKTSSLPHLRSHKKQVNPSSTFCTIFENTAKRSSVL